VPDASAGTSRGVWDNGRSRVNPGPGDPQGNRLNRDARGLRPRTRQEALPPGPPAKGEALCNLSVGKVWEEGQHGPCQVTVGPPPTPSQINRSQGASPLGGAPRGRAPWWVRGKAPAFLVRAIALRRTSPPADAFRHRRDSGRSGSPKPGLTDHLLGAARK
jgi:hypothetical protein